ncbi:MAG TPA: ACP S-malonyltransferase [Actinomycetota bacterium]|nr:ACP S-malonyltransferase [Actinomycetota bacterium]
MRAGLFPGQGVDAATLHAALADAPLLERANEVLGFDLSEAIERRLDRARPTLPTDLAQPALFVAGLAAHAEQTEPFHVYAGHSVGEYTALAAAGALSPEDGLKLVCARGRAMGDAGRASPGGMAAVKGLTAGELADVCARSGTVIANDNSPVQLVIAGPDDALSEAARMVHAAGGRALLLPVEGAFHTDAMAPAAEALRDALDHTRVALPRVPVVSNVTARPYRAPGEVRKLLVRQLTERVRFRESIEWMERAGVTDFVDLGPGRVAGKLAAATVTSGRGAVHA